MGYAHCGVCGEQRHKDYMISCEQCDGWFCENCGAGGGSLCCATCSYQPETKPVAAEGPAPTGETGPTDRPAEPTSLPPEQTIPTSTPVAPEVPAFAPLYSWSVRQSARGSDSSAPALQTRLTAAGIPSTVETSQWHDCECMVASPDSPGGFEIELDAAATVTVSVPNGDVDIARKILKELGLK